MITQQKAGNHNINIINGIHDIKGKTSVNILVSNYTNKHIKFNKGEYVWCLEPTITDNNSSDQLGTHSTNSITLQKMMAEQVQPDTFNPPHHKLKPNIETWSDALLHKYASQFAKDEMSIGKSPLTEMTIYTGNSDPVSQKPYPIAMKNNQWLKEEIEKLLTAKVICSSRLSWSAPIIVVPKGDGGKWLVIDYHALNKVTRKFTWPMPKFKDIFFQTKWCKIFFNFRLMSWLWSYTSRKIFNTKIHIQFTILEIWICQSTFWPCTGSHIFSGINDRHFERFWLCINLFGWYNNFQQDSRRTFIAHQTGLWETMSCKPL